MVGLKPLSRAEAEKLFNRWKQQEEKEKLNQNEIKALTIYHENESKYSGIVNFGSEEEK